MTSLITESWLLLVIALLIGIATAFWVWAVNRGDNTGDHFDANDGLLEKAGEAMVTTPQPEAEPAALKVAPVAEPKPVTKPVPDAPQDTAKPAPVIAPTPAPAPRPRVKPVAAEPVPRPEGKPNIAPAEGSPDNLRLIKGIGPKLNTLLISLGVTRFDQIAGWKEPEIQEVDKYLESFSGRITRDAWIDQAKYLAKDDIAGFEKKYGKL